MKNLSNEFDEKWGGTLTVYEPNLPSGRRGASQEIKAWIAANYIPKQEVKAAIEKLTEEMDTRNEVSLRLNLDDRDTALKVGCNTALKALLSDLNLQD